MCVSCNVAKLIPVDDTPEFNAWLHLRALGDKNMDLPIRFHKHYNKLSAAGKRLNYYIITEKDVQFCFEIEKKEKRTGSKCIGIDTGINMLASVNNGHQYGGDINDCIKRIKRCKKGSFGQKRAIRALKQRIDEVAIEVVQKENPDTIVVENLKKMGHKSKVNKKLNKSVRRSIGSWNWRYWLIRLESQCDQNGVLFAKVEPYYTSVICPECGCNDRENRKSSVFCCTSCGHTANADVNAGRNILARFLRAPTVPVTKKKVAHRCAG